MIAPRARISTLVVAALAGLACTAILRENDDVQRCSTADDCEPTGDPRYVAECRYDPEADLDETEVEKICVAGFRNNVSCDPMSYSGMMGEPHPLAQAVEDLAMASRYTPCDNTSGPGIRGCPPMGTACAGDLVVNDLGFCDVANPSMPAYRLNVSELAEQDIRDAFCQSFFCEGNWVCDRRVNQCRRCDPARELGEGGCGQVYIAGEPSCVYPGDRLACGDGNTDLNNPRFGNCD